MGFFRILRYLRILGFLVIVGAASLFALFDGLHKRQVAAESMAKFQKPVTLSYEEFVKRKPTTGWFRVTGCAINAMESAFVVMTYHDKYSTPSPSSDADAADVNELMVSAYGIHQDPDSPASVALLTRDSGLCGVVSEMNRLGFFETKKLDHDSLTPSHDSSDDSSDSSSDSKDDSATPAPGEHKKTKAEEDAETKKAEDFFTKNESRIISTRTIEGMVDSIDDLDSDQKTALDLVRKHLTPTFVLFEEGQTPNAINSAAGTEIGLGAFGTIVIGLIFAAIVFFAKQRSSNPATLQANAPVSNGLYNRWNSSGPGPLLGGDFHRPTSQGNFAPTPPQTSSTPSNPWSPGRASDVPNPAPNPMPSPPPTPAAFDVFDADVPSPQTE